MLSKEAIQEFKELYRGRYGLDLSEKECLEKATTLMNFYKSVLVNRFDQTVQQKSMSQANDGERL